MRTEFLLWAFVASIATCPEAVLTRKHKSGLRQPALSDVASVDAASKAQAQITKFGPGNCIAAFRNADGHCELETHCKDHDISKFPVKFICIDAGGQKVRHVFAAGSFDPEEQFDTLIECKSCLAEKEEVIQVIADAAPSPASAGSQHRKKKEVQEEDDDEAGGSPLRALKDEVKELEGFMMNTSAELQKLNAKVYSKDFQAGAAPAPAAAAGGAAQAEAKPVKLVHRGVPHPEQRSDVVTPEAARPDRVELQARRVREERRRREEEDEDADSDLVAATKKAEAVASSLSSAMRSAEERDEAAPVAQPTAAPIAAAAEQPKSEIVPLASEDEGEEEDINNRENDKSDAPASDNEDPHNAVSFSALQQQHRDDGDADEGGEDAEETSEDDDAQSDEDASE